MYNITLRHVRALLLQWKRNKYCKFWCVSVALNIQHAMSMCHIILPSVACSTLQHFSTLCHKWHKIGVGRGGQSFNVKFLFWLFKQLLPETFLIIRRTEQDMIINVSVFTWSIRYSCQILTKLEFSQQIFQPILKYQILWKSILWESGGSMWTDGWTGGHDKAVTFCNFLNAIKN